MTYPSVWHGFKVLSRLYLGENLMDSFALCTCYSGALFKTCCEPYLGHTVVPDTAEALMRSRFSAFQFKDAVYLKETWDSKTRPLHLNFEKDERFWSSLEVVSKTGGGPSDERGVIEFKAKYELGEDTYLFH